jgi:dTMP kinase
MKKNISVEILGIPDIGKSTYRKILVWTLGKRKCDDEKEPRGMRVTEVKYPVYDQVPTGSKIREYLYGEQREYLTPYDFQKINAKNKELVQPALEQLLQVNDVVVIDSYIGTSLAYGMADGLDKATLLEMNSKLIKPDVTILLDGTPFERKPDKKKNIYEKDPYMLAKVRQQYLNLAKEFGWYVIDVNGQESDAQDKVLDIVSVTLQKANRVMVPA